MYLVAQYAFVMDPLPRAEPERRASVRSIHSAASRMLRLRVIAWLWGEPLGERRRQPGHLAQLAPHPLSRQTVLS